MALEISLDRHVGTFAGDQAKGVPAAFDNAVKTGSQTFQIQCTLLERELRQAMERQQIPSLPLYPEGRDCHRPTTARVLEVFDNVQRHVLTHDGGREEVIVTQLSSLQRQILKLLGMSPDTYGR